MTTGASLSDDELSQLDTEFKGYASQINDGSMTIQDAADAYKASSGDDTAVSYTHLCSRQSVLYVLRTLWPEKRFEVTLCGTILRGAKECACRITVQ